VTGGAPTFSSWDRSSNALFSQHPGTERLVHGAAIGYAPNAVSTLYALDVGCSIAETATLYLSAFQIRSFATEHEAPAFLESQVYVGP
jgi:hypothetical protein